MGGGGIRTRPPRTALNTIMDYTPDQIEIMKALRAGERLSTVGMYSLVSVAMFGDTFRDLRMPRRPLPPLDPDRAKLVVDLRALLLVKIPPQTDNEDGFSYTKPSFLTRTAVVHIQMLVSYLGWESYFPDEFRGAQMVDLVRAAGLPEAKADAVARWVRAHVQSNDTAIYAAIFDIRLKDCYRIVHDDGPEAFSSVMEEAEAKAAGTLAPAP